MYIESLNILDYRGIKNSNLRFLKPSENRNAVTVLIGKNGSGKTTILELISSYFRDGSSPSVSEVSLNISKLPDFNMLREVMDGSHSKRYIQNIKNDVKNKTEGESPPFSNPQIIYLPAVIQLDKVGAQPSEINLTYEFSTVLDRRLLRNAAGYIKDYIVSLERSLDIASAEKRAVEAVNRFNSIFDKFGMTSHLSKLDGRKLNKPIFSNSSNSIIDIDDLSDGEKQIYGRALSLMMLQPKHSVILIDEPEIALHPAWQYKILDLYFAAVGEDSANQFIICTHSPQVIASTHWSNVRVVERSHGSIELVELNGPPSGADSTSILNGIMGAPKQIESLTEKQSRYRKLFEKREEESEIGKSLRAEIMEHENSESAFFQELDLFRQLLDD